MYTKLDPKDPESLSKFLRQTSPDAASDSIRKAILFGWWLLCQRTNEMTRISDARFVAWSMAPFENSGRTRIGP